jgi:hypothetical protein
MATVIPFAPRRAKADADSREFAPAAVALKTLSLLVECADKARLMSRTKDSLGPKNVADGDVLEPQNPRTEHGTNHLVTRGFLAPVNT